MKKKLKLLLSITTMLFIFKACKPDEKCVDGNNYKNLSEYNLGKIPYKDYSILTLIDKKTKDTLIYSGQGYQYGFGKYIEQGECPQTTNLQFRNLTFINNKNKDQILVENKYISFDASAIGISYKNFEKIFYAVEVSKPYKYDSLIIQGTKYYNVQYLKDTNPYTPFLSIYYNLNYGILKLETNTGDTLELIKLEL